DRAAGRRREDAREALDVVVFGERAGGAIAVEVTGAGPADEHGARGSAVEVRGVPTAGGRERVSGCEANRLVVIAYAVVGAGDGAVRGVRGGEGGRAGAAVQGRHVGGAGGVAVDRRRAADQVDGARGAQVAVARRGYEPVCDAGGGVQRGAVRTAEVRAHSREA